MSFWQRIKSWLSDPDKTLRITLSRPSEKEAFVREWLLKLLNDDQSRRIESLDLWLEVRKMARHRKGPRWIWLSDVEAMLEILRKEGFAQQVTVNDSKGCHVFWRGDTPTPSFLRRLVAKI